MSQNTAKARYEALKHRREPFLRRAREAAALTVPSVMPPQNQPSTGELPQPFSGLGARLVLNLASRLMSALLPPGMPFFRLTVAPEVLIEAQEQSVPPDLERNISLTERQIHTEIERRSWRSPTYLALQHLIVTGNALELQMPDNTIRVFRLDQYVVVRDPIGRLVEVVVEENVSPEGLPESLADLIGQKPGPEGYVGIYTWCRFEDGKWNVIQEVQGIEIPRSRGVYKADLFPYRALRWSALLGEDYGRGKVEEHVADFRAMDGLAQSTLEGAAMAARNVQMIRPNTAGGINLLRRLSKAKNGDVVVGNPEDVTFLQFTNIGGMQFVSAELMTVKQDLAAAFLMGSGMRRDAERVTAYELRKVVEELEAALGGVYSTLAQEMMSPRIRRLIAKMQDNKQIPDWPEDTVEPVVLTGLEALGREADVNRVATALELVGKLPPEVQQYVKWPAMFSKAFTGLGLPDCTRSEEEVAQIVAQQQQAALAQQVAPIAAQAAADQQAAPPA